MLRMLPRRNAAPAPPPDAEPVPLDVVVATRHQLVDTWADAAASASDAPELRFRWARASAALCGHCAAMQLVVVPAARDRVPAGQVDRQLSASRRVLLRMRQLEQLLAGDAFGPHTSAEVVTAALREALTDYRYAEMKLVAALTAALPDDERAALALRLAAAQQRGATRPHPHVPQWRPVAGPAFWFNRQWDDLLDNLDNRSVPAAEARRVRPLSLWGSYVTGMPLPDQARTESARERR
jgi:hypothetical protein